MMKTIVSLAVLVASVSAFSSLACAGLRLKRGSAAHNGALLRHASRPSIAKLSMETRESSISKELLCAIEEGETDGCTASNVFKRKDGKDMTKLEKEQLYLDCCAAFQKAAPLLEDSDYDDLKEDLQLDGSQVMLMSREEIQFMVAKNSYNKGQQIMEDKEFEALRQKLVAKGSDAVKHQASACKILDNGEKECKADLYPEDAKNSILYGPAFFQTGLVFMELAYWTQGWDPIISLIVTSPLIAASTYFLTNKIYFQDPFITRCVCPECTAPNTIFFGDILWVSTLGPDSKRPISPGKYVEQPIVNMKCSNKACGCQLRADKNAMKVFSVAKI